MRSLLIYGLLVLAALGCCTRLVQITAEPMRRVLGGAELLP